MPSGCARESAVSSDFFALSPSPVARCAQAAKILKYICGKTLGKACAVLQGKRGKRQAVWRTPSFQAAPCRTQCGQTAPSLGQFCRRPSRRLQATRPPCHCAVQKHKQTPKTGFACICTYPRYLPPHSPTNQRAHQRVCFRRLFAVRYLQEQKVRIGKYSPGFCSAPQTLPCAPEFPHLRSLHAKTPPRHALRAPSRSRDRRLRR